MVSKNRTSNYNLDMYRYIKMTITWCLVCVAISLQAEDMVVDETRWRTAAYLAAPLSETEYIDTDIQKEIYQALTYIQSTYEETSEAQNRSAYDRLSLSDIEPVRILLFLNDEGEQRLKEHLNAVYGAEAPKYIESTGMPELDELNKKYNVNLIKRVGYYYLDIEFHQPLNIRGLLPIYEQLSGVKIASPNQYVHGGPDNDIYLNSKDSILWKFNIDVPCEDTLKACGYGKYMRLVFLYDRESNNIRKEKTLKKVDRLDCSKWAIDVLDKYQVANLVWCNSIEFKVNAHNVEFVSLSFGKGMDCPSGCIFSSFSAIVDDKGIYPYSFGFQYPEENILNTLSHHPRSESNVALLTGHSHPLTETIEFKESRYYDYAESHTIKQPLVTSKKPCIEKHAGLGTRNAAICYDMLDQTIRGPIMAVIPAKNGFSSPFAIGKYEVKRSDWYRYCELTGVCRVVPDKNRNNPVTGKTIEQVKQYAEWLTRRSGYAYRLPTKSEWMYAANAEGEISSKKVICGQTSSDVGSDKGIQASNFGSVNGWGLKNVIGNVQEWAVDESGKTLVVGAHYLSPEEQCNIQHAVEHNGSADSVTGFRLVREME